MKKRAVTGLIFTVCTFFLLLIRGEKISQAIAGGILFCGRTVIPQLFMNICVSKIVWELGIIERLIVAYPKYGAEISAFVMGILAGFPTGGIICGKLVEGGYITEKRGEYITAFSNNAGVSFVFGYVSTIVGKSGAVSVFLCQLIISLLFAIAFRVGLSKEDKMPIYFIPRNISFAGIGKSVVKATESVVDICGFVLFFTAFTKGVMCEMPLVLKGFAELTTGLSLLSELPFKLRLVYCGMFVGFSGICVHFQIASVCNVNIKKYIFAKCLSGVLFAVGIMPIHYVVTRAGL